MKSIKALILDYLRGVTTLGGRHDDVHHNFEGRVVYIPDERIFIQRDLSSTFIVYGNASRMYSVSIGEDAENKYNNLVKRLGQCKVPGKPREIRISKEFVEWTKAMHTSKNPPKDVKRILEKF